MSFKEKISTCVLVSFYNRVRRPMTWLSLPMPPTWHQTRDARCHWCTYKPVSTGTSRRQWSRICVGTLTAVSTSKFYFRKSDSKACVFLQQVHRILVSTAPLTGYAILLVLVPSWSFVSNLNMIIFKLCIGRRKMMAIVIANPLLFFCFPPALTLSILFSFLMHSPQAGTKSSAPDCMHRTRKTQPENLVLCKPLPYNRVGRQFFPHNHPSSPPPWPGTVFTHTMNPPRHLLHHQLLNRPTHWL